MVKLWDEEFKSLLLQMINALKMDLNEHVNKFSQAVQRQDDEILNNYNTKSSKQIEVLKKKKIQVKKNWINKNLKSMQFKQNASNKNPSTRNFFLS